MPLHRSQLETIIRLFFSNYIRKHMRNPHMILKTLEWAQISGKELYTDMQFINRYCFFLIWYLHLQILWFYTHKQKLWSRFPNVKFLTTTTRHCDWVVITFHITGSRLRWFNSLTFWSCTSAQKVFITEKDVLKHAKHKILNELATNYCVYDMIHFTRSFSIHFPMFHLL